MIYFNYLLNKTNRIFQPAGKEAFGDKSRKTANTLCASLKPTEKWFNKLINSSMTISWVLQAIHTTPLHISLIHGNKQDILGSVHHTHCTTLHFFQHHVQSSRLLFTLMRKKKKKKKYSGQTSWYRTIGCMLHKHTDTTIPLSTHVPSPITHF